ncbi:hypothetical protein FSPOR_9977 [Fusarium sporotrichioides]|uniref:Uncharacterized protein n=1 Tax=Fusarium sporotrichioides TaxID=5514 RepID=A0A395RNW3_FUSSP|nr:hypothetical protein FSPOR_9977 [Fusarium sporotrichioides]
MPCPVCTRAAYERRIARIVTPFLRASRPGFPGREVSVADIERVSRSFPGVSEPVTDETWAAHVAIANSQEASRSSGPDAIYGRDDTVGFSVRTVEDVA